MRRALAGIRAFAVVFGGPVALDVAAAAALVATGRALVRRRRPSPLAAAGAIATGVHVAAVVPWMDRWGAGPGAGLAHAVEIDAPPERVWPWLAQIGSDRGGFYSCEWLENLAGCGIRNADAVHPEWQRRAVGDAVPLHPLVAVPVTRFEPGRALGLEGWGTFALEPLPGGRTRLVVRGEPAGPLGRALYALFVRIPHFVMERRMLLGIKARAEAAE